MLPLDATKYIVGVPGPPVSIFNVDALYVVEADALFAQLYAVALTALTDALPVWQLTLPALGPAVAEFDVDAFDVFL